MNSFTKLHYILLTLYTFEVVWFYFLGGKEDKFMKELHPIIVNMFLGWSICFLMYALMK